MAYIDRLCDQLKVQSGQTFMRVCVAASCCYIYGQEEFVKKGYMEGQKCMRMYERLAGGYNTFEWDAALRLVKEGATNFGEFFMSRVEATGDYWKDYVIPYCREYDIAEDHMESEFFKGFIKTLPFDVTEKEKDSLAACIYVAIRDNSLKQKYTGELPKEKVLPECMDILMAGRDSQTFKLTELACEFAADVCDTLVEVSGHAEYRRLYEDYVFPYLKENAILPGMLMD